MSEIGVRPDQEPSLLGTLNDFAFMAQIGGARRPEPELTRGADAVPLADSDSPSGRREPDRVDPSRVWGRWVP